MNLDSRNKGEDFSLEGLKQQFQALAAVEPPGGLKEKLLAAVPGPVTGQVRRCRIWRWPGATGWASVAATILVFCGVVWLRAPVGPAPGPSPDANGLWGGVLAADYNSVRLPDPNALDSNGL